MLLKKVSPSRLRVLASASLLLIATLAGNAYAAVVYNGGSFGLSLDAQSGNSYTFTYTADFTSWDASGASNQQYIAATNFKPNTGMVPTSYSLLSTNAPGSWSVTTGNANNNGCNTGAADSFVCALASPLISAPTTTHETYKWVFQLNYASPLDPSAFSGASIRAWFVDDTGKGAGLLSKNTNITGVPAPGGVALLGLGVLALGLFGTTRRRRVTA